MIRLFCRTILLLFIPLIVFAGDENIARISLVTENDNISEPFYIGIYFEMEPGWYIYWENPGDAGIPVAVRWDLPEGYSVGELVYPTPERFDTQGLISFGFKDEALLFAEVTSIDTGDPAEDPVISASVSWMVCRESCILEDGTARIYLNDLRPQPQLFNRYKSRIPEDLEKSPTSIESITSEKKDGIYHITIHLVGEPIDDFFPGPVNDFILPHKDIEVSDHSIIYTLQPYSQSSAVTEASGLLFIGGEAFRFKEPVTTINEH
jgi:DsbC/DsbD-like thiol-disulfide interchange protein